MYSWIMVRNNEVVGVYNNRKEAIKHLKQMLKQTLEDINKQDKSDEFDYHIEIPHLTIEQIKKREGYLGL